MGRPPTAGAFGVRRRRLVMGGGCFRSEGCRDGLVRSGSARRACSAVAPMVCTGVTGTAWCASELGGGDINPNLVVVQRVRTLPEVVGLG